MDVMNALEEYATLPLIQRGQRGRLIQKAMRKGAAEILELRLALRRIAEDDDTNVEAVVFAKNTLAHVIAKQFEKL